LNSQERCAAAREKLAREDYHDPFAGFAGAELTCADFREQAARGEITAAECDLLIDRAVLLAVNLEELIQDARAGEPPGWPDAGQRRSARVLATGQHG
jgi:hypothetical protein